MFGLFGRKKNNLSINPEEKVWVEKNLAGFIELFGFDRLKNKPFYLPVYEEFPYADLNDMQQFKKLFLQLCYCLELDANAIEVRFFDDVRAQNWSTWFLEDDFREDIGYYTHQKDNTAKPFHVRLAKSNLVDANLLVMVLVHELLHVKLLGGGYFNHDEPDIEPLTDLAIVYFGFGLFFANASNIQTGDWKLNTGYLSKELISYANATVCYITGKNPKDISPLLNSNTHDAFIADVDYLAGTNDTYLKPEQIAYHNELYLLRKEIDEYTDAQNTAGAISALKQLLAKTPNDVVSLNNLGYNYLILKDFDTAISWFNKAIALDPFWDFPLNNRGYCYLQQGRFDDAFPDLFSSYQMNPENSYSLRNLGAYYLQAGNYTKALGYLEGAAKADPETELINLYLAHNHYHIGNVGEANHFLSLQTNKKEPNYSNLAVDISFS